MSTTTTAGTEQKFEAKYRFPSLSRRWKSVGVFATEAKATAAIDEFLKGRSYRAVDRWVHRVESDAATEAAEEAAK